ncbi:MAG TPA: hypothetical protein VGQ59_15955 [Cyclobacteriaceae bacterium]|jgi:hypothetical protein|nr:hypothetical protein [Cyclobacteriaceae bacterium]
MKNIIPFLYLTLVSLLSCQYENVLTSKQNVSESNGSVVLIKASIKIAVGGIIYENIDGHIKIIGYDSKNTLKWSKDYDLTGPLDTLEVQNGYHHYDIELVDKWGVNDSQTEISAKDIWDGRADGPLSTTYVFGGAIKAKKLLSYVTSMEVNDANSGKVYQPQSRESFTYDGDLIQYIHHETYNLQTLQFEETSLDALSYNGKKVSKIVTTLNGQPYAEYRYEYGVVNKIFETLHFDNDLVWTVTFTNNYDSSKVSVDYSLSNGNSFSYGFDVSYKNIVSDKTIQSSQVCNQGNYTYDKNINPFRHLGYVDFNLQNWSANNKLTEHVDYLACGFPSLIPLASIYTYDQDGYPIKKITKYKSGGNQNSAYHTSVDFTYEK